MKVDVVRMFALARAAVVRLPEPVSRAAFTAVADVVWALRAGGTRQLESNLARLRPDLDRRALRRTSRANLRAYLRYYRETFELSGLSRDQIEARVDVRGDAAVKEVLVSGRSAVLAVTHSGNWDLAGAWATVGLGPVVAVVEHLEPEEIFQDFLRFRTGLGMTIVPLEKDGSTFREMLRHTRRSASVVPLLADRDLSRTGVEVDLRGHPARMAPGPAALALTARAPLFTAFVRHVRLAPDRRRAAGSPWGIEITFTPVPTEDATVATLTQRWVDVVAEAIAAHPDQWHMLQKVYRADLDPARLARARREG